MAETPKNTPDNPDEQFQNSASAAKRLTLTPRGKAAAGIMAGAAAGALVAGAFAISEGLDAGATPHSPEVLSPESLKSLVVESYPADQYIGNFEITSGVATIDQAEAVIGDAIGAETWKGVRAEKYDYLLDSAKALNALFPAPGTEAYVVEIDINGDAEDGNEYIVTLGTPAQSPQEGNTLPGVTTR